MLSRFIQINFLA